jgi:hypothetical protein
MKESMSFSNYTITNINSELVLCQDDFKQIDVEGVSCNFVVSKHPTSQRIYVSLSYDNNTIWIRRPNPSILHLYLNDYHKSKILIQRKNPNKPFMYSLKISTKPKIDLLKIVEIIKQKIESSKKLNYIEKFS